MWYGSELLHCSHLLLDQLAVCSAEGEGQGSMWVGCYGDGQAGRQMREMQGVWEMRGQATLPSNTEGAGMPAGAPTLLPKKQGGALWLSRLLPAG